MGERVLLVVMAVAAPLLLFARWRERVAKAPIETRVPPKVFVFAATPSGGYTQARFSNDGRQLAAWCTDGRVQVWDVGTRELVAVHEWPTRDYWDREAPLGAAFGPVREEAVSYPSRNAISYEISSRPGRFLRLSSEQRYDYSHFTRVTVEEEKSSLVSLRNINVLYTMGHNPDVAFQRGDRLCILDTASLTTRETSIRLDLEESACATRDGETIAVFGPYTALRLYDGPAGQSRGVIRGRTDAVIGDPIVAGGSVLVATPRAIVEWSDRRPRRIPLSRTGYIVEVSPDRHKVGIAYRNHTDIITRSGKLLASAPWAWGVGHESWETWGSVERGCPVLVWSSDSRCLYAGGATLLSLPLSGRARESRVEAHSEGRYPNPSLAFGDDRSVAFHPFGDTSVRFRRPGEAWTKAMVGDVAVLIEPGPSATRALLTVDASTEHLWRIDPRDGRILARAPLDKVSKEHGTLRLTPDHRAVIVAAGSAGVYTLPSLERRYALPLFQDHATLSEDGRVLVTWCSDGVLHLWRLSDGAPRGALSFFHNGMDWAFIAPDGTFEGTQGGLQEARVMSEGRLVRLADLDEGYQREGLLQAALAVE